MSSDPVSSLLSKLTLEEKIHLLGGDMSYADPKREGDVFGVHRIGLPALKFADGPIGVHWWTKAATCYPANIGLAASFDVDMAYEYGRGLGIDCRAVGIHVLLAPGVNLYRSPLCGRNFEYLGEDPELAGSLAAAYIRGVQSQGVAATVKHFAANNQEYDRHGISSDVDERTLREVYFRPFELAVREGESACVMTAYGLLNGQHCSENAWLINQMLREEWGFGDGLVMSDWTSVHSTIQTLNAGLDLEMPWGKFLREEKVKEAIANGTVAESEIDAAVRHRLKLMERFGWLDSGHQQKDETLPERNLETEAIALESARRGIVLLKNDGDTLPARPESTRKIVVLGHHGDAHILCGGGSAYTPPHESITLVEALRKTYGAGTRIEYHRCLQPWRGDEAYKNARFRTPDGQPGLRAQYFNNPRCEGSPVFEEVIPHFDHTYGEKRPHASIDAKLFSAVFDAHITVQEDGDTDFYMDAGDAYLTITVDGSTIFDRQRGPYRVTRDLTAGTYPVTIRMEQTQTGYLSYHFGYESAKNARIHYSEGIEAARDADLVIVATGFVSKTEGEGHDREFEMDPRAVQLITDAATAAPGKTVPVLYIGGAVQTEPWLDQVPAALCLWYPGQNGTLAAAEILAGITNPSGKLPFTWEKQLNDRGSYSCYHDKDGDNRVAYEDGIFTGYRWFDRENIEPRFPFGHGLSYTTFAYENLQVSEPAADGSVEISFDLRNTGSVAGRASALVFVGDVEASMPRPVREFKAVAGATLKPGESTTLRVTLPPRAFAFWHPEQNDWVTEPGEFQIEVGPSAGDLPLRAVVSVPGRGVS